MSNYVSYANLNTIMSKVGRNFDRLSGVCIYKGDKLFENLPTPSASTVGFVYSVQDAFKTTNDFLDGSGLICPAGTNVIVVDTASYSFSEATGLLNTHNPEALGYYENANGEYILTKDNTPQSGKKYYYISTTYEPPYYSRYKFKVIGSTGLQVSEFPTASAAYVGHIYLYVGSTTQNYTNGYFYKCVENNSTNPSTYSWQRINVQPSGSGSGSGQTIQVDTLPTANSENAGKIYQYIGTTSNGLTNGLFYKCIEDPNNVGNYIWQTWTVQDLSDIYDIINEMIPEFDAQYAWLLGSLVRYNGKIYKCTTSHYGPWNSSHFSGTSLSLLSANIEAKFHTLFNTTAFTFDTSASYLVGQYVYNYGALYKCTTAHTGAWDDSHFTQTTIGDELKSLFNTIVMSSTLTLTVADWDSTTKQQTVSTTIDTTKRNVIDIPVQGIPTWGQYKVRAISESASGVTFQCETIPSSALTFNITSMEV